jgi:hypothetical protein
MRGSGVLAAVELSLMFVDEMPTQDHFEGTLWVLKVSCDFRVIDPPTELHEGANRADLWADDREVTGLWVRMKPAAVGELLPIA